MTGEKEALGLPQECGQLEEYNKYKSNVILSNHFKSLFILSPPAPVSFWCRCLGGIMPQRFPPSMTSLEEDNRPDRFLLRKCDRTRSDDPLSDYLGREVYGKQ